MPSLTAMNFDLPKWNQVTDNSRSVAAAVYEGDKAAFTQFSVTFETGVTEWSEHLPNIYVSNLLEWCKITRF